MGNSKKNYLSIKSKLMAAVAMLLVASFMVVSSTYAWFTLSTAPEVTGIRTSIGSNGSLEILLISTDENGQIKDPNKITTAVGQTGKNEVWGNIVDLSSEEYGLSKITLMPSQLNLTASDDGYQLNEIPLRTPLYGSDGRPSELSANTVTGTYKAGSGFKTGGYGVRAVGTASAMTAQQLTFVSANSAYNTAKTTARTTAANTFKTYGNQLASTIATHVAVQKAKGTDDNAYDIEFIKNMLTDLAKAKDSLEDILENYLMMYVASYAGALSEDDWKLLVATSDLASLENAVKTAAGNNDNALAAIPGYADAKAKYEVISTTLTSATKKYDAVLTPEAAGWSDVTEVLSGSGLVVIDAITINNKSQDEVDVIELATNAISVQFPVGSGVYADIAQITSDYSADVTVTISGKILSQISSMFDPETDISKDCTILTKVGTAAFTYVLPEAPKSGNSSDADAAITDFYGYALDFGFRTNATGSKLMLQTTATNRIYSEGGVEDTMGHGSTMTFTTTEQLNAVATENLMRALRIVFVDVGDNNKIIGVGALPQYQRTETKVPTGENDEDGNPIYNTTITVSTDTLDGQYTNDGGTITAPISLYKFTYTEAEGIELGLKIEADDKGKTELVSLVANDAAQISVYVYLEGKYVDNSMVASEGMSLDGTLNLQFSSSANLVPMNYTPFKDQTNSGSTETTTTETTTEETVAQG